MPEVSIILPTYNRADALSRAIASVRQQTFTDWELLVIDDGSTDGTAALVSDIDCRIRLLRQDNSGCYVARNNGLRASRGRYITFLDSDDEWLPHFLEITTAFLRWSPADHFVTTEFLVDWGNGYRVRHDAHKIGTQSAAMAKTIGSRMLDLPPGENDDYLRVYESREPIGDWGRHIAARAGFTNAALYRGHIFEHMRWGYLNWLPVTVITRQALETVGPFVTHCRNAADFRFLAVLARSFRANMIGVLGAIKHDRAYDDHRLTTGHLATGKNEYTFAVNKLGFFDELYWNHRQNDQELGLIRCHHQLYAGQAALGLGQRQKALAHLREACRSTPRLWRAHLLRIFIRLLPSAPIAAVAYQFVLRIGRLVSGQTRITNVLRRGMRTLMSNYF